MIQNQITMSDLREASKLIQKVSKEKPHFDQEILWEKAKEIMRQRMWRELYKEK